MRLAPLRSEGSVELDHARTKSGMTMPPYEPWPAFYAKWMRAWAQGEHVTTIGPTGSGKTRLNRMLLRARDFTVVLGVKNRDPELYGPFQRDGYQLEHSFDPHVDPDDDYRRVLFVPLSDQHGKQGRVDKSRKFRQALNDVMDTGRWCVYGDDIAWLADQLGLSPELEELWMLGRSEGISVVASSQEPVNIPVMAYGAATHLFLFKNPDLYRAKRMAELTGLNREVTQSVILSLPDHEFLYVNKSTGQMIRSKVT